MNPKNTFCSHCGTGFAPSPLTYPRTCPNLDCGAQVWENPVPVSVVLVPVTDQGRTGLLVVRRSIEPGSGLLSLPGGFVEAHESWQAAGAREVIEETGLAVDPDMLECLWFTSTKPSPGRVLLFSVSETLAPWALTGSPFSPNPEASSRGIIFGAEGLDKVFAFPLHARAAEIFFWNRGIQCPHDFKEC